MTGNRTPAPTRVEVISFGYGHGPAPAAHITIDVREHYRDPHVNPQLRGLTAADPRVTAAVLGTSGVTELIESIRRMVTAYYIAPGAAPLTIAIGCVGGRHRSAVIAAEVAAEIDALGVIPVTLTHRDIARPVIGRPVTVAAAPVSRGDVTAPVTRHDTPGDLGTRSPVTPQPR